MTVSRTRRAWLVPAAALAATLGVGAIPKLASAGADTPTLPPLTAAQLIAKARTAHVTSFSGTVSLTSNLGLPDVSMLGGVGGTGTLSLADLVSGTHSAVVWVDGPDHLRVATAKPLAETNWVRNGADVWAYDSASNQATHATIPAKQDSGTDDAAKPAARSNTASSDADNDGPKTPVELAQRLLDKITPTTAVRVDAPLVVANRPAYELVVSPNSAASTVQDVVVSVDAATGMPLDVRVDAKGLSSPAFELGFTRLTLKKPAASRFVFTPPPGARVVQASGVSELVTHPRALGWEGRRMRRLRNAGHVGQPGQPGQAVDVGPVPEAGVGPIAGPTPQSRPTTLGKDWDTVVVLSAASVPGPIGAVFHSGKVVTVGTHTGRLVTTHLLSAVLLDDGRIAVGAVSPQALLATAASA